MQKCEGGSDMGTTIHVHIDEVVLHGLGPLDRRLLGNGIEQELRRLTAESGIAAQQGPASRDRVDAGTISVSSPIRPQTIGSSIAGRVHGAISR